VWRSVSPIHFARGQRECQVNAGCYSGRLHCTAVSGSGVWWHSSSFVYQLMSVFLRTVRTFMRPLGPRVAFPGVAAPKINVPMAIPCLQAVRGMANKRHKKMIKLAKGYRGRANRCFTVAIQRVTKARQYAYRDRKVRVVIGDPVVYLKLCADICTLYRRLRRGTCVNFGSSVSMLPLGCMVYPTIYSCSTSHGATLH
jgi:hypothetical protein